MALEPASLDTLRRFVREREPRCRCDLCSEAIAEHPHHEHLFEPGPRQLLCACTPCALLFPTEARKRYLRVPRRLWLLDGFAMSDAAWDDLAIPVNMAFLQPAAGGTVHAFYPSPAGATESALSLEGWDTLVDANPSLRSLQPDVEALLVNRVGERREHYIAPIDRCYELVGLLRVHWRGLSGGTEVWSRVGTFFDALRDSAKVRTAAGEAVHA